MKANAVPAQISAPSFAPAMRVASDRVLVTYLGQPTNHYIPSPARKIRHYGYGARGAEVEVHREDVLKRPDLFVPKSAEEAKKVWPNYPTGAPKTVVETIGLTVVEPIEPKPVDGGLVNPVDKKSVWPDFSLMTIAEIKELGLDKAGWREVLRQEEDGEPRKTLVAYAKEMLA